MKKRKRKRKRMRMPEDSNTMEDSMVNESAKEALMGMIESERKKLLQ
jgi:hypothetical protein